MCVGKCPLHWYTSDMPLGREGGLYLRTTSRNIGMWNSDYRGVMCVGV